MAPPLWLIVCAVTLLAIAALVVGSRQADMEDETPSSSGGEPDAAPLPDPDAPTDAPAGVSAPLAAQSKRALAAAKPEHTHD